MWEFLCQFSEVLALDEIPSIASLAIELGATTSSENLTADAATADTSESTIIPAIIDSLMREAFDAAIEIAADASPDVKPRELGPAFPAIKVLRLSPLTLTPKP